MNRPIRFEWDDAKALSNARKHGIRFEVATLVFDDPSRVDIPDSRKNYGEDRRIVLGEVQGLVLFVVYTMRGSIGRIISARLTVSPEEDAYHGKLHARQKLKARFQRARAQKPKGKK